MDVRPCFQDTHLCVIGTSFIYTGFGAGGGGGVEAAFLCKTSHVSELGLWDLGLKQEGDRKPQGPLAISHCRPMGVCSPLSCDASNSSGEEEEHGEGWAVRRAHSSAKWLCLHASLRVCVVAGMTSCEHTIVLPIECRLY